MEDYIEGNLFGSDSEKFPYICFAVQFDKTEANHWKYSLRFNVTGGR